MIPLKLAVMSSEEITNALKKQFLCRIAFTGKDGPQIAPFQYVFVDNQLYFHFTQYGEKIGFLKEGRKVCVEIENYQTDFSEYSFVNLYGTLRIVQNLNEKKSVVKELAEKGKANLSTGFLAAHGFNPRKGWSVLDENADEMLIVKLEVESKKGLKSPEF